MFWKKLLGQDIKHILFLDSRLVHLLIVHCPNPKDPLQFYNCFNINIFFIFIIHIILLLAQTEKKTFKIWATSL